MIKCARSQITAAAALNKQAYRTVAVDVFHLKVIYSKNNKKEFPLSLFCFLSLLLPPLPPAWLPVVAVFEIARDEN
jgi:hypothetical protein